MSPAAVVAPRREQHRVARAVSRRVLGVGQVWRDKWRDGHVRARAARLFAAHRGAYGLPAGRRVIIGTVAVLAVLAAIAAAIRSVALGGIPVVAALFAWYWAPTVTAYRRHAPNAEPILVINLFLGWTLVGWVVAMVMAVRHVPPAPPAPPAPPPASPAPPEPACPPPAPPSAPPAPPSAPPWPPPWPGSSPDGQR